MRVADAVRRKILVGLDKAVGELGLAAGAADAGYAGMVDQGTLRLLFASIDAGSQPGARFLGGGWHEMVAGLGIGLAIGLLSLVTTRIAGLNRVFEPVAALTASLLAAGVAWAGFPISVFIATLAGVIVLIPGLFSWADTVRLGKSVGALPNGRYAGEPISQGANPSVGFRRDGAVTAMVAAVAGLKPPPHCLLIDGPYELPLFIAQKGIPQGDAKSLSIAAAVILAALAFLARFTRSLAARVIDIVEERAHRLGTQLRRLPNVSSELPRR